MTKTQAIVAFVALVLVISGAFAVNSSVQAPDAEAWARWEAHDASAKTVIDHEPWERFLFSYLAFKVRGPNTLSYGTVREDDDEKLDNYIEELAAIPISQYNRDEQLAYWVNLYNALTVQLVLDHYPVASIMEINLSNNPLVRGPWAEKLVIIEGESVSLGDIEHRILRPLWKDPRLHYVLNCASLSCPELIRRAYTGIKIDPMLSKAARTYINGPHAVVLDDRGLVLSSLYSWYEEDFGEGQDGVLAHLRAFARPTLLEKLESGAVVADYQYDWTLNDGNAPPRSLGSHTGSFSR